MKNKDRLLSIDIEKTLNQYKGFTRNEILDASWSGMEYCVKGNLYTKGGKFLEIKEFPQFRNIDTYPYSQQFNGVGHIGLDWFLYGRLSQDSGLDLIPFHDDLSFSNHISEIRRAFEKELLSGLGINSEEKSGGMDKHNRHNYIRTLAYTRSLALPEAMMLMHYNWGISEEYLDNLIFEHSFCLALLLDDRLLLDISHGGAGWLAMYNLSILFSTRLINKANSHYAGEEPTFSRLGKKTHQNLTTARMASSRIRRDKKVREQMLRINFAKKQLSGNSSLSAKDLARSYIRTESGEKYELSTLETYFQIAKREAINDFINRKK